MIRDQFQYSDRFDNQCISCGQFGHDIQGCSLIHYNINKSIFLYKVARSPFQPRGKIKSILSHQNLRNKTNCLSDLKSIKTDLKILRWKFAQDTFDDYNDINVFEFSQINEKDKDFYLRCPKIKNPYFQQVSNQFSLKERFGTQSLNQFSLNDYTRSSDTESIEESDYQSDEYYEQESFQQNSNNKNEKIQSIQSLTDQNEDPNKFYRIKTINNNEKEINKTVTKQISKNAEEFSPYYREPASLRNIKDKKLNLNIASHVPSDNSLELDEIEKTQRLQSHTDIIGTVFKKKQLIQQEEKHDGSIQFLRKYLDEFIEKLDCLQKKDTERIYIQDNLTYITQNTKTHSRQTITDPISTQYDSKYSNKQILQQQQNEKVKNLRFNIIRKDVRKQTHRHRFSKRGDFERGFSDFNVKTQQAKEGYYELSDTESSHIFGALKFNFDKMKEFSLYYPKYNYTNIVKFLKKVWVKNNKYRRLLIQNNNSFEIVSQIFTNTPKVNVI